MSVAAQATVIDNVSVIDVATGTVRAGQRVVVTNTRITAMGPMAQVSSPAAATTVDGTGRFLMPGLWDMHVHAAAPAARAWFAIFLANGVTGVRDMASGVDSFLAARAALASGSIIGPRMVGGGVLVDGTPIVYPAAISHPVRTPDEARHAVDSLASRGVDFIKAYEMLPESAYFALADQARRRGIPYAGHLPLMVDAVAAARAGHKSFEHLRGLEIACSGKADSLRSVARRMIEQGQDQPGMRLRASIHSALRPVAYATYDEATCARVIAGLAGAGAWQTPNLVLSTQGAFRHDTTESFQRWVRFMPEPQRTQWQRTAGSPGRGRGGQGPAVDWALRLTKRLHDAGVRVLPGTDFPIEAMVPGAAVHEELALLVKAGLTNAEALRAGTLNPPTFLGLTDSLGTVEVGKVADLVLLDANPLENIRHLSRVRAVWSSGRYLNREALDGLLAR